MSATPVSAGDDRIHAGRENARIQGLRQIVATGHWAKIDGEPVGPYSASHVVALHDRLTSPTREAYARPKGRRDDPARIHQGRPQTREGSQAAVSDLPNQPTILLRAEEVALLLGIGRTKVFEMLAAGELPAVRIGRCVRISRTALEVWVLARSHLGGDARTGSI